MQSEGSQKENLNRIITVPNLLSFFRFCLIPVIIWSYCVKENPLLAGEILLLSGLTDLADGYIARRFHMISNLGKILDPVADKLTQAAGCHNLIKGILRESVYKRNNHISIEQKSFTLITVGYIRQLGW